MTLDGKIATTAGHAAWVSSALSRQRVFDCRARSDAVVVGGQTVRRDDPRLTTRRDGGHAPARVVMSRTLDLPQVGDRVIGSAACADRSLCKTHSLIIAAVCFCQQLR